MLPLALNCNVFVTSSVSFLFNIQSVFLIFLIIPIILNLFLQRKFTVHSCREQNWFRLRTATDLGGPEQPGRENLSPTQERVRQLECQGTLVWDPITCSSTACALHARSWPSWYFYSPQLLRAGSALKQLVDKAELLHTQVWLTKKPQCYLLFCRYNMTMEKMSAGELLNII